MPCRAMILLENSVAPTTACWSRSRPHPGSCSARCLTQSWPSAWVRWQRRAISRHTANILVVQKRNRWQEQRIRMAAMYRRLNESPNDAHVERAAPQGLLHGGSLRAGTPVRTPSDAAAPAERADQARELALGNTRTAPRRPTGRAGGPGAGPLRTFGASLCDAVSGQDTREGPHGQDQRRACLGLCDRVEQLLPGGILLTYAVTQAEHRQWVSCGILGEDFHKRPALTLLCHPSPNWKLRPFPS